MEFSCGDDKALISGSNDGTENQGGCDYCCLKKNKKHQRCSKINVLKWRIEGKIEDQRFRAAAQRESCKVLIKLEIKRNNLEHSFTF